MYTCSGSGASSLSGNVCAGYLEEIAAALTSLEDAMPQLDILYMTRVQRERFFNEADYLRRCVR